MLRFIINNNQIRKSYTFLKNMSFKFIYQRWPWLHEFIFVKLKAKIRRRYLNQLMPATITGCKDGDRADLYETPPDGAFNPMVSIIVPNYRHARFLRMRLDSIYGQTYQNFEVILLDDASDDESQSILNEYADSHPNKTQTYFNTENSGSVFRQWKKGLELARGELIWIAESDDFCTPNFLDSLVGYFENKAIRMAYCQSVFVTGDTNQQTWSIQEYLSDIDDSLWRHPFIMSSHAIVNKAWACKNIVPNVSSAVFRHPGKLPLMNDHMWQGMRICGDWIFYLHLVRGGLIAYETSSTNYYRIHPQNTSAGTYTKDIYYIEHERVAEAALTLYRLEPSTLDAQRAFVEAHWLNHRPNDPLDDLCLHYDLKRVMGFADQRKPNIMMATLGFSTGGGETFPLLLANLLHARGYAVTVFNCHHTPTEPGIRSMLDSGIPVIELTALERIGLVTQNMGIEIIHSHHAWVDSTICSLLEGFDSPAIVVTTHGMHEMIEEVDRLEAIQKLADHACHIVYVADKNLHGFRGSSIEPERFTRIENALPIYEVTPADRSEFGISASSFVLCLASRAIPEKGWAEALEITERARTISGHDIHLVLAGDGPEFHRLKQASLADHIHLLGFRSDVRALFAMANLGFLPSRFKGESAPLVLIECLHAGRPMLASDLGEIRRMLSTTDGLAGNVIPLTQERVDIEAMAQEIARFASDRSYYEDCLTKVSEASRVFAPERMIQRYEHVYAACFHRLRHNRAHVTS
ncbi:MAG: glycosyltransferase [Thermodesulfobacteriota bacterium]